MDGYQKFATQLQTNTNAHGYAPMSLGASLFEDYLHARNEVRRLAARTACAQRRTLRDMGAPRGRGCLVGCHGCTLPRLSLLLVLSLSRSLTLSFSLLVRLPSSRFIWHFLGMRNRSSAVLCVRVLQAAKSDASKKPLARVVILAHDKISVTNTWYKDLSEPRAFTTLFLKDNKGIRRHTPLCANSAPCQ